MPARAFPWRRTPGAVRRRRGTRGRTTASRARCSASHSSSSRKMTSSIAASPVEHDRAGRQLLEQRADRRDAAAAGDQQRGRAARRCSAVKMPHGPSANTAYAGLAAAQVGGVVADHLHGQPQPAAVRRGRQRERVRLPPAASGQEPPAEVLPGAGVQVLDAPAR